MPREMARRKERRAFLKTFQKEVRKLELIRFEP